MISNIVSTERGEIKLRRVELSVQHLAEFRDPIKVQLLCSEGCDNFGKSWTCPPNAKSFEEFSKGYVEAEVFLFVLPIEAFNDEDNPGMACYDFLKGESKKILLEQEVLKKGVAIISHTCDLCTPCAMKLGQPCVSPRAMRYHMTSFGFRVDTICDELFQHSISWTSNSGESAYITQVGVVLF